MKRYLFSFFFVLSFLFTIAPVVSAQELCPPGQFSSLCNIRLENNSNIVGVIITILFIIAIISAVIFFIIGGIRWIMSGGDKGKLDQARAALTAAVIGLILTLLVFFFVNIIFILFTGETIGLLEIPRLIEGI